MERKEENIKYSILNNENILMVAATANDARLTKLGLIPNKAGYRVTPI